MTLKMNDDFYWEHYTPHHIKLINEQIDSGIVMELDNFECNDVLTTKDNIHQNAKLIYQILYELKPESVFEIGVGFCNHVVSISKFLPNTKITGCDISSQQYACARNIHSDQKLGKFNIRVCDFLCVESDADILFSQACIMHMSTEKAMLAIEKAYNSCKIATILLDGAISLPLGEKYFNRYPHFVFEKFAKKYDYVDGIRPVILMKTDIQEQMKKIDDLYQ